MTIRLITIVCGLAIIVMAIRTKNDKTGQYLKGLQEKYTEESSIKYVRGTVYSELFFGAGLIIEGIFGSGVGYIIGSVVCLLGLILLIVFMKDLKKKNLPYRNEDKKK